MSFRIKWWKKISQTTITTTTTPTMPAVIPAPPFLKASEAYPTLRVGYNSTQVAIIDNLVQRLNLAVNSLTQGKFNFQILKDANFNVDTSQFSDPNAKFLVLFFLKVFKMLLNSGNAFTQAASPQQVGNAVDNLVSSSELSSISGVNPTGAVANQMPGNSDIVQTIKNTLAQLKQSSTK